MCLMREAARLMRLDPNQPGPALQLLKESLQLCAELSLGSLTRPCSFSRSGAFFLVDGVPVPGQSLPRHLEGCREGLLIGATLGIEADRLLKARSLLGLTHAAAMQAALSARLEQGVDELCDRLSGERPGYHLTPRFSPGYGDLPLSYQNFIFQQLQMGRLGVSLTPGLMMVPTKSITALAGWRAGAPCQTARSCARCPDLRCPYREEDAHEIS
ncbi:MAG: hypothetical protein ACOYI7_04835 [Candidatus Excrementavichristensenella sp.]